MPAIVNVEKCTGCEDCVATCPVECISMIDGKAKVTPDDCTDCEACVSGCNDEAITMQ